MHRLAGSGAAALLLLLAGCTAASSPGRSSDRTRATTISVVHLRDPALWPPAGTALVPAAQIRGSWSSPAPITAWISEGGQDIYYADEHAGCATMTTRAREDDAVVTITEHVIEHLAVPGGPCAASAVTVRLHLHLARALSSRPLTFTMG